MRSGKIDNRSTEARLASPNPPQETQSARPDLVDPGTTTTRSWQEAVDHLLIARRWSRRVLAQEAGLPVNTVHGWWIYNREPKVSHALAIARVLGTDVVSLFGSGLDQTRRPASELAPIAGELLVQDGGIERCKRDCPLFELARLAVEKAAAKGGQP